MAREGITRNMTFKPRHEVGKGGLTQIAGKHTSRGRLPMAEAPGMGAGDQGSLCMGVEWTPLREQVAGSGEEMESESGHLASGLNDKEAGHWASTWAQLVTTMRKETWTREVPT